METPYIVLRGTNSRHLDGEWYDLRDFGGSPGAENVARDPVTKQEFRFEPTDEYEMREDGARARVYRVNR